jgi:GNAT superfamily N-acetyltransferase
LLNSSDTKLFVVENIDNKDLGAYCIVRIMTTSCLPIIIQNRFVYIDNFCVKDSYKRNGVGKLLFQYIVDYAKSEGLRLYNSLYGNLIKMLSIFIRQWECP